MDLPTYTNIWRIEKRLYKLYDFRLPQPLPVVTLGVLLGVCAVWFGLMGLLGVPFRTPFHVLWLVPPGIITFFATRPVIEGKRLTELLISQGRFLTEARVFTRLSPEREPTEIALTVRVWHRDPAAAPLPAPSATIPAPQRQRAPEPSAPLEELLPAPSQEKESTQVSGDSTATETSHGASEGQGDPAAADDRGVGTKVLNYFGFALPTPPRAERPHHPAPGPARHDTPSSGVPAAERVELRPRRRKDDAPAFVAPPQEDRPAEAHPEGATARRRAEEMMAAPEPEELPGGRVAGATASRQQGLDHEMATPRDRADARRATDDPEPARRLPRGRAHSASVAQHGEQERTAQSEPEGPPQGERERVVAPEPPERERGLGVATPAPPEETHEAASPASPAPQPARRRPHAAPWELPEYAHPEGAHPAEPSAEEPTTGKPELELDHGTGEQEGLSGVVRVFPGPTGGDDDVPSTGEATSGDGQPSTPPPAHAPGTPDGGTAPGPRPAAARDAPSTGGAAARGEVDRTTTRSTEPSPTSDRDADDAARSGGTSPTPAGEEGPASHRATGVPPLSGAPSDPADEGDRTTGSADDPAGGEDPPARRGTVGGADHADHMAVLDHYLSKQDTPPPPPPRIVAGDAGEQPAGPPAGGWFPEATAERPGGDEPAQAAGPPSAPDTPADPRATSAPEEPSQAEEPAPSGAPAAAAPEAPGKPELELDHGTGEHASLARVGTEDEPHRPTENDLAAAEEAAFRARQQRAHPDASHPRRSGDGERRAPTDHAPSSAAGAPTPDPGAATAREPAERPPAPACADKPPREQQQEWPVGRHSDRLSRSMRANPPARPSGDHPEEIPVSSEADTGAPSGPAHPQPPAGPHPEGARPARPDTVEPDGQQHPEPEPTGADTAAPDPEQPEPGTDPAPAEPRPPQRKVLTNKPAGDDGVFHRVAQNARRISHLFGQPAPGSAPDTRDTADTEGPAPATPPVDTPEGEEKPRLQLDHGTGEQRRLTSAPPSPDPGETHHERPAEERTSPGSTDGDPARGGTRGWRRLARVVTGGGSTARVVSELPEGDVERLRTPFGGPRQVVVLGCTGGAGQTVTTLMLGHTLATYRDARVVAVDVNPGSGGLSRRISTETPETVTSLLANADSVHTYGGMRAYTSQAGSRLEVVATLDDPYVQTLDDRDYAGLGELLGRFYELTVLDPAATGVARALPVVDGLVLVAPASADAARAVSMTFEWLDGHGYADLRARSVVVVNGVSKRSLTDVDEAEQVARGRCRAIVRVPWDDHFAAHDVVDVHGLRSATRRAHAALAGVLMHGFAPTREEVH